MRYLILAVLFLAGCATVDPAVILNEKNQLTFNKYRAQEPLTTEGRNNFKFELKKNYYDTISPSRAYQRFINGVFADSSSPKFLSDIEIQKHQKVIQQEIYIAQLRYENKRLRRQRTGMAIARGLEDFGRGYQSGAPSYHGSAQEFRDMVASSERDQILNEQRQHHQQQRFQHQQQQNQQREQRRQQQFLNGPFSPSRPFGWRFK